MEDQAYFYGTGRRKTAIARVKIMPGRGAIVINGIPYEELMTRIEHRVMITKPLIEFISWIALGRIASI